MNQFNIFFPPFLDSLLRTRLLLLSLKQWDVSLSVCLFICSLTLSKLKQYSSNSLGTFFLECRWFWAKKYLHLYSPSLKTVKTVDFTTATLETSNFNYLLCFIHRLLQIENQWASQAVKNDSLYFHLFCQKVGKFVYT